MRQLTYVAPRRLEWRDAPEPVLGDAHAALVRPLAVATCDLDRVLIAGGPPIPGPFALGHEGVGEVIAAGEAVGSVRPGDRVAICFQISCGTCARCRSGLTGSCSTTRREGRYAMFGMAPLGGEWGGFLSDLVRVPHADANLLRLRPDDDAAVLASLSDNMPDAWRAVCGPLARHPAAEVIVVGGMAASVGLYAVMFARALGASGVRYVDEDPERCRLAETLGAVVLQEPPPRRLPRAAVTVDGSGTGGGASVRAAEHRGRGRLHDGRHLLRPARPRAPAGDVHDRGHPGDQPGDGAPGDGADPRPGALGSRRPGARDLPHGEHGRRRRRPAGDAHQAGHGARRTAGVTPYRPRVARPGKG
jgi:threonine dehydrogenase-like Zn-dependent dehydrogenase